MKYTRRGFEVKGIILKTGGPLPWDFAVGLPIGQPSLNKALPLRQVGAFADNPLAAKRQNEDY